MVHRPAAENLQLFWVIRVALLFIAVSVLLKLPSLTFEHDEPDEVVYWSVARNLVEDGEYTLRGSPVLESLSPRIYDRPLFHHPPLYCFLLAPFVVLGAPQAAVTLSWAGHALCILSVALIGYVLLNRSPDPAVPRRVLFQVVLLGVAIDPLLIFVSRKLWIDSLLAGLVALSLALVYLHRARPGGRGLLPAGGLALGLAGLAKLPGLLAAPIATLLIRGEGDRHRSRPKSVLAYAVPCTLAVLPWLLVFYDTYGLLTPTWLRPDDWALEHYPLVAEAVGRPWYYYVVKLGLVLPIFPLLIGLYAVSLRRGLSIERWLPLIWIACFLGVSTYQGVTGYGFQMRYLTPLVPALYAALFCHPRFFCGANRWGLPLLIACVLYAVLGAAVYLPADRHDQFLTLFEGFGLIRF